MIQLLRPNLRPYRAQFALVIVPPARRRRPVLVPLAAAEDVVRSVAGDPASEVEQALTVDRVVRAAALLTPLQRQVFGLRFVAGLSVQETAEATGPPLQRRSRPA